MANLYKNKVVYGGNTLIDLSGDTVTSPAHIVSGRIGHLANGDSVVGTGVVPSGTIQITENGTVDVTNYASAEVDVSGGGGLPYNSGTFTFASDTNSNVASGTAYAISHGLGARPDLIVVWTDDFVGLTENPYASGTTKIGFIWAANPSLLPQRLTASVVGSNNSVIFGMNLGFINSAAVNVAAAPTSASYTIADSDITDTIFCLQINGTGTWWRSGITYRWLAAKAGVWDGV